MPNARLKSVADGYSVNIPKLGINCEEGRRRLVVLTVGIVSVRK